LKAQPRHLPLLDTLRALAVLMVLWSHVPVVSTPTIVRLLRSAINPGYLGVDLFFVLSGFLITRILLVDRLNQRPLRLFLVRRSLRIFPIYYLLLAFLFFLKPGKYLGWCAVYLSNFHFMFDKTPNPLPHTWSLAIEEHFYLIWPPIVRFCSARRSKQIAWGLIGVAVISAVATVLLRQAYPDSLIGVARDPIYRGSIYRFGSLLLGAQLAFHEEWLMSSVARLWRLAAGAIAFGGACVVFSKLRETPWFPFESMVGFAAISAGVLLGALALGIRGGPLLRRACHPALTYIGRISYGLYLYHFPIYYWFGLSYPKGVPPLGTVGLAIACSFGVAALSYRFIEQPLLSLKSRFR
jgi:peptidoglycan/LPS O-acetylase OafA/YrhL